jgi:hypothetical protein
VPLQQLKHGYFTHLSYPNIPKVNFKIPMNAIHVKQQWLALKGLSLKKKHPLMGLFLL